jgi:lysozyme
VNYTTLKAELERDEGRRLTAYRDSLGYWTIGVGHLLGSSPRMSSITDAECDALFVADVQAAEKFLDTHLPSAQYWAPYHGEAPYRALVNMAFNLGPKLLEFKKFLAALSGAEPDFTTAAKEMLDSLWAKQVGDRAQRLHDMILSGGA